MGRLVDAGRFRASDDGDMTRSRWVLLGTGAAVVVAVVAFVAVGWDRVEGLAAVLTVLVGLAGLGLAVWAGLPPRAARTSVEVNNSGSVYRAGTSAAVVTGVDVVGAGPDSVLVRDSGKVDGDGDGDVTTGFRRR
jgi:hypothetical protein